MGLIEDVNERVSVETRRESFGLVVDEAVGLDTRFEVHYRDLLAVRDAVAKVLESDRYVAWLQKQGGPR